MFPASIAGQATNVLRLGHLQTADNLEALIRSSLQARTFADGIVLAVATAMRQRVLVEAPLVAQGVPLVYLPRPCVRDWSLLDIDRSRELVAPSRTLVVDFLATAELPEPRRMSGEPHHHDADDGFAHPPVLGLFAWRVRVLQWSHARSRPPRGAV